mgnify:CR=1 FL=1
MSAEDLDNYETDAELALYREYRDVIKLFTYVVETERRFYLANKVDFNVRSAGQDVYFDVQLTDAWVWDVYRSQPFRQVRAHRDLQGRERRRSPENRYRHSRRYSLTGNRLIQPVLTMRGIPSSYGGASRIVHTTHSKSSDS